MNEIEVFITLFISSFISSTILPGHSEITLTTFIFLNKYNIINLIFIASLGNILGSILNWYLGFHFVKFNEKKWFPINKRQLEKASLWFLKYGKWSLFLSWVPFVGDPLTVVAGVLRVPIITFLIIVSISKILRYVIVSLIALNLF
ncbi:DedA family protein [Alphaproteobacteria bacterium]|nr:DedA family protein [Alphaproteobacteria bacterium]